MEQKELTKQENIINLYNQLNKAGQRGEAIAFMSGVIGVKKSTVKNHYVNELPDYLTEEQLNEIISYLQKQVAINNKVSVD